MNEQTAQVLRSLNDRFYAQACVSFGETRHNRWPGWERLLETTGCPGSVLDLACGNMRFEAFLERAFPQASFTFDGVDLTAFPVWDEVHTPVTFHQVDLLDIAAGASSAVDRTPKDQVSADQRLVNQTQSDWSLTGQIPTAPNFGSADLESGGLGLGSVDLAVSFGFLHHVPGQKARLGFLRWMCSRVRPGGYAAVSFWRFLDEPSLAAKALPVPAALTGRSDLGLNSDPDLDLDLDLDLDPGDAFLGWQGSTDLVRYCHSFSDADIDELVADLAPVARVAARYRADGRSGALNEYVVWQV